MLLLAGLCAHFARSMQSCGVSAGFLGCCGHELGGERGCHFGGEALDQRLQKRRHGAVHLLQLAFGVRQELLKVIVRSRHAVDQVLEHLLEFVEELLGFFREAEDAVVHGGQVELVEDAGQILFVFLRVATRDVDVGLNRCIFAGLGRVGGGL